MDSQSNPHPLPIAPPLSRRERFVATRTWLVLKNVLGWLLIVVSLMAGPLVPGPGGIPLFLVGFALISFPGKRRLTARVLRGRPVRFRRRQMVVASVLLGLVVPALVLAIASRGTAWRANLSPLEVVGIYLVGAGLTSAAVWLLPRVLNLGLHLVAKARRRVRPWLRRHHIHLLPPRWRRRHPHEHGHGPFRLTDEILRFYRRKKR